MAWMQCDYGTAEARHTQSLALCRELGDRRGEAWALNNLGVLAMFRADFPKAESVLSASSAVYREIARRKSQIHVSVRGAGPLSAVPQREAVKYAWHEQGVSHPANAEESRPW